MTGMDHRKSADDVSPCEVYHGLGQSWKSVIASTMRGEYERAHHRRTLRGTERSGRVVGEPLEEGHELGFDFRCEIKELDAEESWFGPTNHRTTDSDRSADMRPLQNQFDRLFNRITPICLEPTSGWGDVMNDGIVFEQIRWVGQRDGFVGAHVNGAEDKGWTGLSLRSSPLDETFRRRGACARRTHGGMMLYRSAEGKQAPGQSWVSGEIQPATAEPSPRSRPNIEAMPLTHFCVSLQLPRFLHPLP